MENHNQINPISQKSQIPSIEQLLEENEKVKQENKQLRHQLQQKINQTTYLIKQIQRLRKIENQLNRLKGNIEEWYLKDIEEQLAKQEKQDAISEEELKQKVIQQLRKNIDSYLFKAEYFRDKKYFDRVICKKQVDELMDQFLNQFQASQILPPNHPKQLLFILQYFNQNEKLILQRYLLLSSEESRGKFLLNLSGIEKESNWKRWLWTGNWNHLGSLRFYNCQWFENDHWRAMVRNANSFQNLTWLDLDINKVRDIKQGDVEKFESLKSLSLENNPISAQSDEILKKAAQKNQNLKVTTYLQSYGPTYD